MSSLFKVIFGKEEPKQKRTYKKRKFRTIAEIRDILNSPELSNDSARITLRFVLGEIDRSALIKILHPPLEFEKAGE